MKLPKVYYKLLLCLIIFTSFSCHFILVKIEFCLRFFISAEKLSSSKYGICKKVNEMTGQAKWQIIRFWTTNYKPMCLHFIQNAVNWSHWLRTEELRRGLTLRKSSIMAWSLATLPWQTIRYGNIGNYDFEAFENSEKSVKSMDCLFFCQNVQS